MMGAALDPNGSGIRQKLIWIMDRAVRMGQPRT
jgi:hypothetical protein